MADGVERGIWPSIVVAGLTFVATLTISVLSASWSLGDRFVSIRDHQALIDEVRHDGALIVDLQRGKADHEDVKQLRSDMTAQHSSALQKREFDEWLAEFNRHPPWVSRDTFELHEKKQTEDVRRLQEQMTELSARVRALNDRLFQQREGGKP